MRSKNDKITWTTKEVLFLMSITAVLGLLMALILIDGGVIYA